MEAEPIGTEVLDSSTEHPSLNPLRGRFLGPLLHPYKICTAASPCRECVQGVEAIRQLLVS